MKFSISLQVKSSELRSESPKTDDDEAFVSAEFGDDEKIAVSRAMEMLLVDMEERPASACHADDERAGGTSEDEGDDDVFREYRQHLESRESLSSEGPASSSHSKRSQSSLADSKSSSSMDRLKSDSEGSKRSSLGSRRSGNLVNSTDELGVTDDVLRSVKEMSDHSNSTAGSGDTTLQVLRSVSCEDEGEKERCIQYLDDRFVTKRARASSGSHRSDKSNSLGRVGSSDSFTISTPSQSSPHTSHSSLNEEYETNKQVLAVAGYSSEDERPDSRMMEDYNTTMSQVLEEEDEAVPDLETTLHADDAAEATSPRSEEYLSPRSDLGDASDRSDYQSPRSDRASSVYATPETSLTEPADVISVDEVVSQTVTDKDSSKPVVRNSKGVSGNSSKSSAKSDKSSILGFNVKKKKSDTVKSPKVIKSDILNTPVLPVKSQTIIRPLRHRSREGSVEANPLERDAWGDSSSCSSLNSVKSTDASQRTWRPLPPVPTQSHDSPTQSRTVKQPASRKLPDPGSGQTKSPVVFQSKFMKKAYSSNTDSGDSSSKSLSPTESKKPVITSQPRPLPPTHENSDFKKPCSVLPSASKTKIKVDYSKLTTKDSDSETDKKKKRIPVAIALKKSIKPTLSNNSASSEPRGEQSDDIPFADDSDDDFPEEIFFTPATSVKSRKVERRAGERCDARKRILPVPPKEDLSVLSSDVIRDIRRAEMEKAREEARQRARLKSDEELGVSETPSKYRRAQLSSESSQRGASSESSQNGRASTSDRVSESDEVSRLPLAGAHVTFTPNTPGKRSTPKPGKEKKKSKTTKSRESSLSSVENLDTETKKENKKKRSLLASILSGVKTPTSDKSRDKDGSSSNDNLEEKSAKKKKTKTPKSEKKKKEKKRKTVSVDDSLLSDNMRDLKIGSVFTKKTGRRPAFRTKISPPKASG